jgi:sigma-B regulation protein RsbU (phosphoserine phosphatase)
MTALYTLDVSGHGIRSALTSVMFSRLLTPGAFQRDGDVEIIAPDRVVDDLNRRFQDRLGVDEYFTLLCATYDQRTGILRLCQAGHPGPLLQRADGGIRQLGQGGFPVGLLPFAEYETFDLALHAGDRLVLFSDGVTECMNPAGEQFGEDRLEDLLRRYSERRAGDLITALMGELRDWNGSETFNDDVSVIAVEVK